MTSCNILIYGGGAVGSILGWRLAQHTANEVSVVCRSNFQSIQMSGYTFSTRIWGAGHFMPRHVFKAGSITAGTSQRRFDYVICANKITGDYRPVLADLRAIVRPETTLVTAQNGMGIEESLRQAFQRNTVLTSICSIGCRQVQPGFVEQTAGIKKHAFAVGVHDQGRYGSSVDEYRLNKLTGMCPDMENINGSLLHDRWQKLIFNSAWNSTTALTGLDTHRLLAVPGAAEIILALAKEAWQVATASGVQLDSEVPQRTLDLAKTSATIIPSTLQDARAGRPLELEPIFGFLVKQAATVGVKTPHISLMYNLLRQMNDTFTTRRSLGMSKPPRIGSLGEWIIRQQPRVAYVEN